MCHQTEQWLIQHHDVAKGTRATTAALSRLVLLGDCTGRFLPNFISDMRATKSRPNSGFMWPAQCTRAIQDGGRKELVWPCVRMCAPMDCQAFTGTGSLR
jgi:hypothetical protein